MVFIYTGMFKMRRIEMKAKIITGLVLGCIFSLLFSEEGMVPLSEIHKLDLRAKGFRLTAQDIFNPGGVSLADAIVNLSGCTASFVSPDGLMLTNHHCAFRAIQSASTGEHDYLKNGFSATDRAGEIEARGYTARVTETYRDVSGRVLSAVRKKMSFAQKTRAIERRIKEIEVAAERQFPGKRAEVAEMFPGKTYVLFIYTYLRDIRLVYAPPQCIGEFGGEEDNWMWPRHNGDFSILRAYTGPDGEPATYSPDNVPFHPRKYIRVNPRGVDENDLVFILGYPGRTYRHRTSYFLAFEQEIRLPFVVKMSQWMIDIMEQMSGRDRSLELKLSPRIKGLSNRMKNYQGKLQGLKRLNLVEEKRKQEAALQDFIRSDRKRQKKYDRLPDDIGRSYQGYREDAGYELTLENLLNASELLDIAFTICEGAIERQKKDLDRISKYMNRNIDRTRQRLFIKLGNIHPETDRAIFKKYLLQVLDLPKLKGKRIAAVDCLAGIDESGKPVPGNPEPITAIDRFLDEAYSRTRMQDADAVKECFEKSPGQLKKSNDPFLKLAMALYPEFKWLEETQKSRKGVFDERMARLIEVKSLWLGSEFIPDANGTFRLTFGHIRGYWPADAVWYRPLSTLNGVVEKNTGNPPFEVPEKLLDLYRQSDWGRFSHPVLHTIPVAMLYDADTTGGNSGSPVLDKNGELVGLNFDRTFEATINDFAWNQAYSRSIGVDIRYVCWILEKFSQCQRLLAEMGVVVSD
jgi:hypothetical protein